MEYTAEQFREALGVPVVEFDLNDRYPNGHLHINGEAEYVVAGILSMVDALSEDLELSPSDVLNLLPFFEDLNGAMGDLIVGKEAHSAFRIYKYGEKEEANCTTVVTYEGVPAGVLAGMANLVEAVSHVLVDEYSNKPYTALRELLRINEKKRHENGGW